MHHCHIALVFILIMIQLSTASLTTATATKQIPLKAPSLSKTAHVERSSINISADPMSVKLSTNKVDDEPLSNPCNGMHKKTNGTTCGLKEIMMGRCYEYQYLKQGVSLISQPYIRNCTQLYEAFEAAVRYKSHCRMNLTTYEKYFDLALSGVHVINKTMFWSGTYHVAHVYSANGRNYVTLEDTLAAAMVNGLVWCGKENDTEGFDFVSCPDSCKSNSWADLAFWGLASQTFAQLASGDVFVVLNGSQASGRQTFRNTSYFARFELPNLRRTGEFRVMRVNVLLLHTPDQPTTEKCGEKTLINLEELVRGYGFEYSCVDDPDDLILIMCSEKREARECQVARQVLRQTWQTKLYGKSDGFRHVFSLTIVWCLLVKIILYILY